jgi:hypothetical protein
LEQVGLADQLCGGVVLGILRDVVRQQVGLGY